VSRTRKDSDDIDRDVERMLGREDLKTLPLGRRVDVAILELAGADYAKMILRLLRAPRPSSRALTAMKGILQRSAQLATGERKLLDELGVDSREELFAVVRAWNQAKAGDEDQRVELALRVIEQRARERPDERDAIFRRVKLFTGGDYDAGRDAGGLPEAVVARLAEVPVGATGDLVERLADGGEPDDDGGGDPEGRAATAGVDRKARRGARRVAASGSA